MSRNIRQALAGTNSGKSGPPVADGVLSVTPDTPDVVDRRKRNVGLDCVETASKYLDGDGDAGAALARRPVARRARRVRKQHGDITLAMPAASRRSAWLRWRACACGEQQL